MFLSPRRFMQSLWINWATGLIRFSKRKRTIRNRWCGLSMNGSLIDYMDCSKIQTGTLCMEVSGIVRTSIFNLPLLPMFPCQVTYPSDLRSDVDPLLSEEIFGPILPVIEADV